MCCHPLVCPWHTDVHSCNAHSMAAAFTVAGGRDRDRFEALQRRGREYVQGQLRELAKLLPPDALDGLQWTLPSEAQVIGLAHSQVLEDCCAARFPWLAPGEYEAGIKAELQFYLAFKRFVPALTPCTHVACSARSLRALHCVRRHACVPVHAT